MGGIALAGVGLALVGIVLLGGGSTNLALNAPVEASRSLAGAGPGAVVDGDSESEVIWNSGADPPQWIEIDLRVPSTLTGLRLVVAQDPAGETRHRVLGRADTSGSWITLHVFGGRTSDGDVLSVTFASAIPTIRFVRIVTASGPSWAAWREIEVLGRR